MDPVDALACTPAALDLGGRRFVVLPPTPRDMLAVNERMKAFAKAKCRSPLDYALAHTHLNPVALELAVTAALRLGAGNGARPDPEAVWDEFSGLDGVRWRTWYHVSRAHPEFTLEAAAELVTEDNLFDAAAALDAALKLAAVDPKGRAPATGSPS